MRGLRVGAEKLAGRSLEPRRVSSQRAQNVDPLGRALFIEDAPGEAAVRGVEDVECRAGPSVPERRAGLLEKSNLCVDVVPWRPLLESPVRGEVPLGEAQLSTAVAGASCNGEGASGRATALLLPELTGSSRTTGGAGRVACNGAPLDGAVADDRRSTTFADDRGASTMRLIATPLPTRAVVATTAHIPTLTVAAAPRPPPTTVPTLPALAPAATLGAAPAAATWCLP